MKRTLSERNIVVALFIMVLITFAMAQEATKKMGKGFNSAGLYPSASFLAQKIATPKTVK